MSGLLQVLNMINPRPAGPPPADYEGLEYKWKMFTLRPAYYKMEAIAFVVVAAYLGLYLLGRYINTARAKSTFKPLTAFLNTQFARSREILSSGPAQHLLYSTGRRNALCLHTTVFLYPVHDLVSLFIHIGQSIIEPTYDGSENVLFNLTLGLGSEGKQGEGVGVWAVADKGSMRVLKEKRWDLTFARLQEHQAVPVTHALFTEHSEVNDILFKTPSLGITELLKDSTAASVLKYLVITDQAATRPTKGAQPSKMRKREIILSTIKPSNKAQEDAVIAWLQVTLNIADLLAKPNLVKPEISRKLIRTREQVDAELTTDYAKERREESGELSKEETAEERRLAKKKAERATMSEKELRKLAELEKKRDLRKMQKKGAKGGASGM